MSDAGTQRRLTLVAAPHDEAEPSPGAAIAGDDETSLEDEQLMPQGILHNKHDVKVLNERISLVLTELAKRGVAIDPDTVDVTNLRARSQAYAACRILVLKGICTEAEMQAEESQAMLSNLYLILNIVEQQQLQRGVQAVRGPKIITATH